MLIFQKEHDFLPAKNFNGGVSLSQYAPQVTWPGTSLVQGGLCPGGRCPGVSVWGSLSSGALCGGLCPGDLCQRGGGLCPGGLCLDFSVQSGLCPGGFCPRGSLSGCLCLGGSVQGVFVQGVFVQGVSVREYLFFRTPNVFNTSNALKSMRSHRNLPFCK